MSIIFYIIFDRYKEGDSVIGVKDGVWLGTIEVRRREYGEWTVGVSMLGDYIRWYATIRRDTMLFDIKRFVSEFFRKLGYDIADTTTSDIVYKGFKLLDLKEIDVNVSNSESLANILAEVIEGVSARIYEVIETLENDKAEVDLIVADEKRKGKKIVTMRIERLK